MVDDVGVPRLTLVSEAYTYVDNEDYKRMRALKRLANGDYREDVLSDDLGHWVLKGVCYYEYAQGDFRP